MGCRWSAPNCPQPPEPWLLVASLVSVPGRDTDVVRHVVTLGGQGTKAPLLSPTTHGRRVDGRPSPPKTPPPRCSSLSCCRWSSCLLAVTQAHCPRLPGPGLAPRKERTMSVWALRPCRPVLEAGGSLEKSTVSLVWAQEQWKGDVVLFVGLVPGSVNACRIKGIHTQTHLTGQPGSLWVPVPRPHPTSSKGLLKLSPQLEHSRIVGNALPPTGHWSLLRRWAQGPTLR